MANELLHDVAVRATASKLTQAEYDSIVNHKFNAQAIGDMLYASTATQLRRLGIGSAGQVLQITGGIPAWSDTLTAKTFSGDITLGANKFKTTSLEMIEESGILATRYIATGLYAPIRAAIVYGDGGVRAAGVGFYYNIAAGLFDALESDGSSVAFRARDTGVGHVEVARMVGAADPYFQMTLAMRLNPIATASLPATPVEGMLAYDDTANKLKFWNGAAWETVTSAV